MQLKEMIESYATGDLARMIADWKTRGTESVSLPQQRPVFRSEFGHQITGVRVKSYIWEAAKAKMLTEKARTGGSMSALIELLLWEYAGSPVEALEGDTTSLDEQWFFQGKKGPRSEDTAE